MMRLAFGKTSGLFVGGALLSLLVADVAITTLSPGAELARLLAGILHPDIWSIEALSVVYTVAFAVLGVALGSVGGFALSIIYGRYAAVRAFCVIIRSVHELFWALLLIQIFGLSATAGILAIALPYTGIFAKVYAEMIEEADLAAVRVLPRGTGTISTYAYARLPELADRFKTYTLYRLECGLRSTLVLGFIGLPTIGFHLESYFKQGQYAAAAALVGVFYVLIGTRRLWARAATLPVLVIASVLVLPATVGGGNALVNLARFLGQDIVPFPLRHGHLGDSATWSSFGAWLWPIVTQQILPGGWRTLVLAQMALVVAGVIALLTFPFVSATFYGRSGHIAGRVALVVVRSTPEYMMAYVLLQVFGPSMLPAVIALAIHNGGIVGYLLGRHADTLDYRRDAPRGLDLYCYETVPRLYPQFMAYMLYRWEIIVRESAIFGILGVTTLGYYIDGAISELRFDVAVVLIAATVLLSAAIDFVSRKLRQALRISVLPVRLAEAPSDRATMTVGAAG